MCTHYVLCAILFVIVFNHCCPCGVPVTCLEDKILFDPLDSSDVKLAQGSQCKHEIKEAWRDLMACPRLFHG